LLEAAKNPKTFGAWNVRLDAFLKTKQVRDRMLADPQTLSTIAIHSQQRLNTLRPDSKRRMVSFLKGRVIRYSTAYPRGLRFNGDSGNKHNSFPYDQIAHPAVRLHGAWGKEQRK
jgi:hypothetical protein